jgi:hypothetical protein
MTHIDEAALATCTLTLNLLTKLKKSGALSEIEIAEIFSDSIRQHRAINTHENDAAASFLESARISLEQGTP